MSYGYHQDGTLPPEGGGWIFVFGSNESGRHGKGASKVAEGLFGAKRGVSYGLQGESFAIPVKDARIRTLPLEAIRTYVDRFLRDAAAMPDRRFFVARVGCGPFNYSDEDMAPMFRGAPTNCNFAHEWAAYLGSTMMGQQ